MSALFSKQWSSSIVPYSMVVKMKCKLVIGLDSNRPRPYIIKRNVQWRCRVKCYALYAFEKRLEFLVSS